VKFKPLYDIPEGIYDFHTLKELDIETALSTEHVIEYLCKQGLCLKPFPEVLRYVEYKQVDIDSIDDWVELVYRWYVKGMTATSIEWDKGNISDEELENWRAGASKYDKSDFVYELASDFERIDRLVDLIGGTGIYYPPTLGRNLNTVDGAHRCVALRYLDAKKIHAWIFRYVEVD